MGRITMVVAIAASGCGRIDFDPIAAADAAIDTTPAGLCGGPDTACPVGAAFCDDFETSSGATFPRWSSLDLHNWGNGGAANPGTAGTATAAACRGSVAFHDRAVGSAQIAFLLKTISPRPNPMYVRFLVRIASTSPPDDAELVGIQKSGSFINVGFDRANQLLAVNTGGLAGGLGGAMKAAVIPTDQWMCVETRVLFSTAASGSLSVSLDGTLIVDVANVVTDTASTLDLLVLGMSTSGAVAGTYDIDVDDVVVSGMPIGCN